MRKMILGASVLCHFLALHATATHPLANEFIEVALTGENVLNPAGNRGAGDPDAFGFARLEHDHGTLLWQITYQNVSGQTIDALHIHGPGATPGNTRPIFIDIPLPQSRPLPAGAMSGVMTGADDPGLQTKMAFLFFGGENDFYLDLHTSGPGSFPDGAIRGQLPEPTSLGLGIMGVLALSPRRSRHSILTSLPASAAR